MERADVAVVGGGPAGASAARAAAEQGAETVLFESGVPRADREGVGADSTDAAGMLDYWVDILGHDPASFPDGVVLQELDGALMAGPNEELYLEDTGISASYDGFGFTFHRARFDDWLRSEAQDAGADFRVGTAVADVDSRREGGDWVHELALRDGSALLADALVLADGPQRRVTMGALDQFLPDERAASAVLSPPEVNHIAYQEHRRFPPELFDPHSLKFWWGWMPGETAYPWIFPNDDGVARVGLTMPIGLDLEGVDRSAYRLLREDDDTVPDGATYLRRLLRELYPDHDLADFPLVEDRGKSGGTETYPISSTYPVDSPTRANVAVAGGAMGTTSAFHEGGTHVAVATGREAGRLAGGGDLSGYNDAWKDAVGDEIRRNVAMAEVVGENDPDDWDRVIRVAREMSEAASDAGRIISRKSARSAAGGLSLYSSYRRAKFRNRGANIVQLAASEYEY
ncbi:MAG: NAD(P)/FAD-dependent oxidoreductase [Halobacteriaceae archaeon]